MTGSAVLLQIAWFDIRGASRKLANLLLGLMLTLPLFLALLVSWVGHGFKFMEVALLVLMLLPGLTVLAFSVSLLLFEGPYIGLLGSADMGHFGVSFLELLILF